ncbi:MAG: DUF1266 domain-containing protein [Lachnospiraceae bacterium]|nr:DUF1266 domain-containing protein [Lachnospiraceae bacterium]
MKKKIKRMIWLLFVGMLAVGMLTGCGSTGNEDGLDENVAEETTEALEETAEEDEQTENESNSSKDLGDRERKSQDELPKAEEDMEAGVSDKPITMADLLNESGIIQSREDVSLLPESVLWFNATYATLTYSNGCDWRIVGGMEPTEENADLTKALLFSGWSVLTREDALDTAERLIEEGHRGKCQNCMDELEEWGFLELSEEEFMEKIMEMDPEENLGRYVITYYMHLNGIEPEYIAAFDLCRVNELYGYYYVCGFMDYEEAMDASLDNSLALQKMYGSWEEMMDAYLLGYQFWRGDLMISDDSPTRERYHYYEMLSGLQDNPYDIDWNTELKKSW